MGMEAPLRRDVRMSALKDLREQKMAAAPENFVRGSADHFYRWLRQAKPGAIPDGPAIWICGDCHYGNLGPVGDGEGSVNFRIRDFDQAVIGNPAHDLLRLALSLASAARGSDLPGLTTAKMMDAMIVSYRAALDRPTKTPTPPPGLRKLLKSARQASWRTLVEETAKGAPPKLPLGKKFWPLTKEERVEIDRLFSNEAIVDLAVKLKAARDGKRVEVVDAAHWRKGCSSLGRLRYAVLLAVGPEGDSDHCLMDIKEAVSPQAPRLAPARMPNNPAERVMMGARSLSPELGERMAAAEIQERPVFVRELLPQDKKVEISSLDMEEAAGTAGYLAHVVGVAHARQMQDDDRALWRRAIEPPRSTGKGGPDWLWTNVVELLAIHDRAFLEHCRSVADRSQS